MNINAQSLANKYRDKITNGDYADNGRLPSVRELAEIEGVSTQTAATVYSKLEALGLVRTSKKSGTYANAGKSADIHVGSFPAPPVMDHSKAWKATDPEAQTSNVLYKVVVSEAGPELAEWGIEPGARVVERHYRKDVDGRPVQHKVTILPYELASRVPEGYQGVPPMMTPVGHPIVTPPNGISMPDWLGWNMAHVSTSIAVTPMTKEAASVFSLEEGAPGHNFFTTATDSDGNVLYVVAGSSLLTVRYTVDYANVLPEEFRTA